MTLIANVPLSKCAATMPHQEKMSKTGPVIKGSCCSSWFASPLWPSKIMIHATSTVRLGRNTVTQKPNSSQRAPGRSVRASNQAMPMAITRLMAWRVTARLMVFPIALTSAAQ